MSDLPPKNSAIYEPGTLDQTRKNIGNIDAEEAKRMTRVLGGQIYTEKSAPIDLSKMPKQPIQHTRSHSSRTSSRSKSSGKAAPVQYTAPAPVKEKKMQIAGLPDISQEDWQLIDHLMMSPEYKIKPNYGIFNFVRYLRKNGIHKIEPDFVQVNLKRHLEHMEAFITVMKTLIQVAPNSYKARIQKDDDLKFRFLRKIAGWSLRELKLRYIDIEKEAANVTVADLVPYTREIYGMLAQILYLGETRVSQLIKEIYTDELEYPDSDRKKITLLAKDGVREWAYLYTEAIKGMYPLLMRMCGGSYQVFPVFFASDIKNILNFLGKTKFDLLLVEKEAPDVPSHTDTPTKKEPEPEPKKNDAAAKQAAAQQHNPELVKAGLSLLNTLFPDAGFTRLETMPDMYPYFQPLFQFEDGFNLLSPENPLQVLVVLLRILEDFFHGCRNIDFNFESGEYKGDKVDTISSVINDWSLYREMQFNKEYASILSDFVNELYTQSDFTYSQYGKKLLNKLLWLSKYHFLPLFNFEKLLLERPENDMTYKPLYKRTDFICRALTEIAKGIDKAGKNRAAITGIQNPWSHYKFDIPNTVSERLDVLLAAKRDGPNMTATNANLLKYTLCIMSVLNWWINDPTSPAYQTNPMKIYRVSSKDGSPVFSVPVRDDQKQLFAGNIQALAQKKAAEKV